MVVRMRSTRGHTGNRRSHHAITEPRVSLCQNCKTPHLSHRMCQNCGMYRGKVIIDMAALAAKADKKRKAKEMAEKK